MQREIGDVLIAWENEAFLSMKEVGRQKVEIVVPSQSILAEPPVAVVDKVVDKKGTRSVAQAYLEYLYSPEGQEIAAKITIGRGWNRWRKNMLDFSQIKLVTIDEVFGGWQKAQKTHFADGGVFDQIISRISSYTMTFTFKKRSNLPGFGLALGFTVLVSQPDCIDSRSPRLS